MCLVMVRSLIAAPLAVALSCKVPSAGEEGLRLQERWFQTQPRYANAQPVSVGDLVVSAAGDGQLIARDVATGAMRWTSATGPSAVEGANLVAAGGVIVAPVVVHTVGVDARTGALRWIYRAPPDTVDGGAPISGSVAGVRVDSDELHAYIPAWGGVVAAVSLASGAVDWSWRPDSAVRHRVGAQGVRVVGGVVFAALWHFLDAGGLRCEGWVLAIDAREGRELWWRPLPDTSTAVCMTGRPAVADGHVIVMMNTGALYALNARDGSLEWRVPPEPPAPDKLFNAVLTSPVIAEGIVYADAGTEHLRAFRVRDGSPVWRSGYPGQITDDVLVTERHLLAPSGMRLLIFDRASGRLLRELRQPGQTSGALFPATPAATGSQLFIPVNGGLWSLETR